MNIRPLNKKLIQNSKGLKTVIDTNGNVVFDAEKELDEWDRIWRKEMEELTGNPNFKHIDTIELNSDSNIIKKTLVVFDSYDFFKNIVVDDGTITKLPKPTSIDVVFDEGKELYTTESNNIVSEDLSDLDKVIIELRNWYDIKNAQYPANDIESKAYKKGWQNGVSEVLFILTNIRDSKK